MTLRLKQHQAARLPGLRLLLGLAVAVGAMAAINVMARTPSQTPRLQRFEFTQPQMGTTARIVLYSTDATTARRAADAGFARIDALDDVLSDYRDNSELNRLASSAGTGPVQLSPDLYAVLEAAQSLAARSGGAFDITRGAVTRIWRQARRLDEAPDRADLDAAVALGDYRNLQLDAHTHSATLAHPGMRLDVGGIAKGYAVEQALRSIHAADTPNALVSLGGDIAIGAPPPGQPGWKIEVAGLDVPGAPPARTLLLRDVAVSTAGDAEQWMEIDGVRHSHVLDARSGRPLTFRSTTTVIAPRGLQADGLDTAASVLGADAGTRLVDSVPGAAMRMVRQSPDGNVQITVSSAWPTLTSSAAVATTEHSQ